MINIQPNLGLLKDIFEDIQPSNNIISYTENDLEELRESINMIITDFVENNIKYYKEIDFIDKVYTHTNNIMTQLYLIDLFEDIDVYEFIMDGIHIYFNLIGIPRSYPNSIIINSPKENMRNISICYVKYRNQTKEQMHGLNSGGIELLLVVVGNY